VGDGSAVGTGISVGEVTAMPTAVAVSTKSL
jgi:hypothetical protein